MNVAQILKYKGRAIFAVRPDNTLMEAAKLLAEKRIGAVVASNDQMHVLGIISERDIIRALSSNGKDVLDSPVSNHMTHKVLTVKESTLVADVEEMMTKGRFRHVPVVEGDTCVAVISIVDIVKHRVRDVEFEHQALQNYISSTG